MTFMESNVFQIIRYLIAFTGIFVVVPGFIFVGDYKTQAERIVANYIKMVLLLIILGYLLVLIKLYEVITLTAIFVFMILRAYLARNSLTSWQEIFHRLSLKIYDFADGRLKLRKVTQQWFLNRRNFLKNKTLMLLGMKEQLAGSLLFLIIFIYTGYLRFYDAFRHAAPAMSDAYVTLVWMKYINNRILFHDGIYPQGFHIYLSVLNKFAAVDSLYVLKYTGPLNSVFITMGLYFFLSRMTGIKAVGMLAALSYGLLGNHLNCDWIRQASTNSQEFAFVFIFPSLYFFYKYLKDKDKRALWTGWAGLLVTGLVHTVAFAFTGLGLGCLIISGLAADLRSKHQEIINLTLVGLVSVLISLIPLGLGLLFGKEFHGSSAEYLFKQNTEAIPILGILDFLVLGCILLLLFRLFLYRGKECNLIFAIFMSVFGIASFGFYYLGGSITRSLVVASRSRELWGFTTVTFIAIGFYLITDFITNRKKGYIELSLVCFLLISTIVVARPQPIIPYKMEYDSSVEQYLKISSSYRPTEWMIVSQEEGYALAYGKGYHLMLQDFLAWYNPEDANLMRLVNGCFEELKTPHIFLYQEKEVFRTIFASLQENYLRRKEDSVRLGEWVAKYQEKHDNISIFYEDDQLRIYHIEQPLSREETLKQIWED